MKRTILLILLAIGCRACPAANVTWSMQQLFGSTNINPGVTLYTQGGSPRFLGTNILFGPQSFTPTNGLLVVSNASPITLVCQFDNTPQTFTFNIPADTNTYNFIDLVQRYNSTVANVTLAAGTNTFLSTNWQLGIQTISINATTPPVVVASLGGNATNLTASGNFSGTIIDSSGTNQTGSGALTNLANGNGSALASLTAANLNGTVAANNLPGTLPAWAVIPTNAVGAGIPPSVTISSGAQLYAWNGNTNTPGSGAITVSNATVYVVGPGPYFAPVLPLAPGVNLIGINNPVIYRTNQTGANETDEVTAGPFLQPNNNTFVRGIKFVATNGVTIAINPTFPSWDAAVGNDDTLTISANSLTNVGLPSITNIVTNAVFEDCVFQGEVYAAYLHNGLVGSTNTWFFRHCEFDSACQAFYVNAASVNSTFANIYFDDHCTFNGIANTNLGIGYTSAASWQGIGVGLHIFTPSAGMVNVYDHGSSITAYGTNTVATTKYTCGVRMEHAGGLANLFLNGTLITPSPIQTSNWFDINYNASIANTSVYGYYFNSNFIPAFFNGIGVFSQTAGLATGSLSNSNGVAYWIGTSSTTKVSGP